MNTVDKIVTEWAFRCKKGYPDFNNPQDMRILSEIYAELGIVLEAERVKKEKVEIPSQSADDYVKDPESEEHLYVRTKDIDSKTGEPLANARRYRLQKKDKGQGRSAKYVLVLTPEEERAAEAEAQRNKKIVSEDDYVKSILTQANAEELFNDVTGSTYYKKADNIDEFVKDKDAYIGAFASLYKYKVLKGGLGELIPLVSIKGAKVGGSNEKDIIAQGKTLEVKEIVKGGDSREFALASTAGIAGTKFQEHLETFKKAVKPFRFLPRFRIIDVGVVDVNKVPREYLLALEELLANFPYTKENIDSQSEEIKIGNKKYTVRKGAKYAIELDDKGNLIQTENSPKESQQLDSDIRKLLNHPWIKDNKEYSPLKDLNKIKVDYLNSIDYLMLWTSPETAVIVDTKKEAQKSDSDSLVKLNRIALGNLTLTYSTKQKPESEKEKPDSTEK